MIEDYTGEIHEGDSEEVLSEMPESSVHMAVCSPPYYGLRDYGEDGQIGLEDSLDEYIQSLVDVGKELKRVLRDDGSWWLNLGDTYSSGGRTRYDSDGKDTKGGRGGEHRTSDSFGPKQKMLVPHRAAIALQSDGWVVRNDVTWVKPNPMPSSVTDRLNTTTEQIFHLTPEPDYWYDLDAIREPYETDGWYNYPSDSNENAGHSETPTLKPGDITKNPAGKNPGDVFEIAPKPFPDAHFAVYPPDLIEKPIKATCPPKVCVECGTPYEREVEREERGDNYGKRDEPHVSDNLAQCPNDWQPPDSEFKGWRQTCDCDTDAMESGIVLDPFIGAGTTAVAAERLRRRWVGIDINPEYVDMAHERVEEDRIESGRPASLLDK